MSRNASPVVVTKRLYTFVRRTPAKTYRQHHSEATKRGIAKKRLDTIVTINKDKFAEIVARQDRWDLNRQIEPRYLNDWPAEATHRLHFVMFHYHRRFQLCEEHVRTRLSCNGRHIAYIDMPLRYWQRLAK